MLLIISPRRASQPKAVFSCCERTLSISISTEASKESLRRPKQIPKRHLKSSKASKKGSKIAFKLSNFRPKFGHIFSQFWRPRLLQEETKKETTFGTARCRLSGVHTTPHQDLNESGAKATEAGTILSKKERDECNKAL